MWHNVESIQGGGCGTMWRVSREEVVAPCGEYPALSIIIIIDISQICYYICYVIIIIVLIINHTSLV